MRFPLVRLDKGESQRWRDSVKAIFSAEFGITALYPLKNFFRVEFQRLLKN
jgi:hypothetical protein